MGFWENVFASKTKIGILGCGWIGIPLAKNLIMQKYGVYGSTTRSEKVIQLEEMGLEKVFVGRLNPTWEGDNIKELLHADVVVLDFPPGKASYEDFHWQQMEALLPYLGKNTKIVYTSSTSVYPELGREVYEQDVTTVAQAAHQKLIKAEAYLKNHIGDRLTILRCGGLTGWDRNLAKFFAGKSGIEGLTVPVNLVHGEDVVRAIIHIIQTGSFGETYNLVAPKHPSKAEFYTDLCKKSKLPLPHFQDITENVKFKIVNSNKIQEQTGFKFKFEDPMLFEFT